MKKNMEGFYFKEITVYNSDKTVKVVLHWDCHEGIDGEYNPKDLSDIPLLRFDVYAKNPSYHDEAQDGWRIPEDSSYCTQIDARKQRKYLQEAAKNILREVDEPCRQGNSIKKLCEGLSWIE